MPKTPSQRFFAAFDSPQLGFHEVLWDGEQFDGACVAERFSKADMLGLMGLMVQMGAIPAPA